MASVTCRVSCVLILAGTDDMHLCIHNTCTHRYPKSNMRGRTAAFHKEAALLSDLSVQLACRVHMLIIILGENVIQRESRIQIQM